MKILKQILLFILILIGLTISVCIGILAMLGISQIIPTTFIGYNAIQFIVLIGVCYSYGYLFGYFMYSKF